MIMLVPGVPASALDCGYLSTAARHGTAIFTAILGALTGNPGCRPSRSAPEPARKQSRNATRHHTGGIA
jgi:hypothetical protein